MTSRAKRLRTKRIYNDMKGNVKYIKLMYVMGNKSVSLSKGNYTHDLIRSLNYLGIEYTVKLMYVYPHSERCKGSKNDTRIKLTFIPKN